VLRSLATKSVDGAVLTGLLDCKSAGDADLLFANCSRNLLQSPLARAVVVAVHLARDIGDKWAARLLSAAAFTGSHAAADNSAALRLLQGADGDVRAVNPLLRDLADRGCG
jgi:hypothetical protein